MAQKCISVVYIQEVKGQRIPVLRESRILWETLKQPAGYSVLCPIRKLHTASSGSMERDALKGQGVREDFQGSGGKS